MRDPPDASVLLALAEAAESSPEDCARARAIAEREHRLGMTRYDAVRADLVALYGQGEDGALLARLAADIRAGRFDRPGEDRARVSGLLRRLVRLRLEESNPGFMTNN